MIDVKQFGAVGDGVTDDTAAIQAAIDAAADVDETTCFPHSSYVVTGSIVISSAQRLVAGGG